MIGRISRPLRLCVALLIAAIAAGAHAPAIAAGDDAERVVGEIEAIDGKLQHLRSDGLDALYALDYDRANGRFTEMIGLAPERLEGYLFRAMANWSEGLVRERLRSIHLFGSPEFHDVEKRSFDAKTERALRADLDKAIDLGKRRLDGDARSLELLYHLGLAYAIKGGFDAQVGGSPLGAMKNAGKSVDLHKEIIKADPDFVDAYLSLGMQNYIVGSLPLAARLLASTGGFSGSKKDGLAMVERVAKEGRRASDDALAVLVGIYVREQRIADALDAARTLRERHPRNYSLAFDEASLLVQLGKAEEAAAALERMLATTSLDASVRDEILYAAGRAYEEARRFERALESYEAAAATKGADGDVVTLSLLGSGRVAQALGRDADAERAYLQVLARPDYEDAHKNARKGLETTSRR